MFRRNRETAPEVDEGAAAARNRERYERFCEYAHELPLLTDAELQHFAETGEQVVISSGGLGVTWSSSFNTQFLIRLRRTLLAKSATIDHEL